MAEIWEAIRPYSGWIIFGVFLLLMMRMHAGGGCGMGHGQHGSHGSSEEQPTGRPTGRSVDRREGAEGTDRDDPGRAAVTGRRSGSCH
jgi:hypothetical protein